MIARGLSKTLWIVLCAWLAILGAKSLHAATAWVPFGPDGGDARRIAPDPHDSKHLFLGTANGWIYESRDGGAAWHRLARVGRRDDLVLDHIVVDPGNSRHLIVGAYALDKADGGMFISSDGGATWISQAEMRGQSVRSLAMATSDPKILVAGTLKGVYRSTDGGQRWSLISPLDSMEIHEVQSIAIDPKDPNVVYAGTWHLPWKTTDAGQHWDSIKEGIIEDSDVFSIIVDPKKPQVVYASACSGIYKSVNAGATFDKVKGIATSARRTRVLLQDPSHLETVFAGTTEGLFRSDDAGRVWQRTTGPDVIVNDVYVDPTDARRVLIATDRGGVQASDDGGDTFHSSNSGFSARQITAMKRDERHPATIYVGVVNDKEWGGVFQSDNGGLNWAQKSDGLGGRDVFSLGQAPDGTLLAGTVHGIFRLDGDTGKWDRVEEAPAVTAAAAVSELPVARAAVPVGRNHYIERTGLKTASVRPASRALAARGAKGTPVKKVVAGRRPLSKGNPSVVASKKSPVVKPAARAVATATAVGGPALVQTPNVAVAPKYFDGRVAAIITSDQVLLAATSVGLLTSVDQGVSWHAAGPEDSASWRFLAAAKGNVIAASLREMQFSSDSGAHWADVKLPGELTQISSVAVEPNGELWVGGREGVYCSSDGGSSWTTPKNLFVNSVTGVFYDEGLDRVYVTSTGAGSAAFTVQLPAKTVTFAESGWNLRFVRPVGDHLVAATFFDGIVVQPKMVPAPVPAAQTAQR